MPVPASRTNTLPWSVETSTQEVFPPKRTVSAPGVATEPRQPQTVTRIGTSLAPEDRHGADELVGMREKRDRGDRYLAVDAVRARHLVRLVRCAPFVEGDPGGPLLERQWIVRLGRPWRELRRPFLQRQLTHLRERASDNFL